MTTRDARQTTCANADSRHSPRESAETGAFPFSRETIYAALAVHQVQENGWPLRETVAWLQPWAARLNQSFGLRLSDLSFRVDWLRARRLGHFRQGTTARIDRRPDHFFSCPRSARRCPT